MIKSKKKILCFFGTRPEAIKMAPVVRELKKSRYLNVVVAVSAQHRSMLDQVLKLFKIRSQVDLNLMRDGQSVFDVTTRVLKSFEPVLDRLKPDLVLIHGDTTTNLSGALAAYYKKIPVGHVEAGLRTGDRYQPFPEEMNRRLSDALSTLYFAPTKKSKANLLKENHQSKFIFQTGNTVIDALFQARKLMRTCRDANLKKILGRIPSSQKIVLMTAHRRENFGKPFKEICQSVKILSEKYPNVHWIYPVHPNPNVKGPAHEILKGRKNIHLLKPLDYGDLVYTMSRSHIVVTDSGGLQEEAPSLGKPVLVLREVTERPEAVSAGTVTLVGSSSKKIVREFSRLIEDKKTYMKMANAVNPYGDGQASRRIRQAIEWYYGFRKMKPNSFRSGS